jgi:hypothetical protein
MPEQWREGTSNGEVRESTDTWAPFADVHNLSVVWTGEVGAFAVEVETGEPPVHEVTVTWAGEVGDFSVHADHRTPRDREGAIISWLRRRRRTP